MLAFVVLTIVKSLVLTGYYYFISFISKRNTEYKNILQNWRNIIDLVKSSWRCFLLQMKFPRRRTRIKLGCSLRTQFRNKSCRPDSSILYLAHQMRISFTRKEAAQRERQAKRPVAEMVSRLFEAIGDVLAPPVRSCLEDFKNHWRAITKFYVDQHYKGLYEYNTPKINNAQRGQQTLRSLTT